MNECKPFAIRIVDYKKHSSYYKKYIKSTDSDNGTVIVYDEIGSEERKKKQVSDIIDYIVLSDSEKEDEDMAKPKIRPVDIKSYIRSDKPNISNCIRRISENVKAREDHAKVKYKGQNKINIDFKKNQGLVGLKIVQASNFDKPKNSTSVENGKSNEATFRTSETCKTVKNCSFTSMNKGKSQISNKILENNKQNDENLSDLCLKTKTKETIKTSKRDKQKNKKHVSSSDSVKKKTSKGVDNKEQPCNSKYFKDVWDKDLRLGLKPQDSIQKLNFSKYGINYLKHIKDRLKRDKQKNRNVLAKTLNHPIKSNTHFGPHVNNNEQNEQGTKPIKDKGTSRKKYSQNQDKIVNDGKCKSMPSLLTAKQTANEKKFLVGQVPCELPDRDITKLSNNKCLSVKETINIQEKIPNQKMLNFTTLDMQELVAQRKDKDNDNETPSCNVTMINKKVKFDVQDKDKVTKSTAVDKPLISSVSVKDKTVTLTDTTINNQQLSLTKQADISPILKLRSTPRIPYQSNSQTKDKQNQNFRKNKSPAKYTFYPSSSSMTIGSEHYLKHTVIPQECVLSYVQPNNQFQSDPINHTGPTDVQKSSNLVNVCDKLAKVSCSKANDYNKTYDTSNKTLTENDTNSMQDSTRSPNLVQSIDTTLSVKNEILCNTPVPIQEDSVESSKKTMINTNEVLCDSPVPIQKDYLGSSYKTKINSFVMPNNSNLHEGSMEDQKRGPTFPQGTNNDNLHLIHHVRLTSKSEDCLLKSKVTTARTAFPGQPKNNLGGTNDTINGKPIHTLVTNRTEKDNQKTNLHINIKNTSIHCAPTYDGQPQNMPHQNQQWIYQTPPPSQEQQRVAYSQHSSPQIYLQSHILQPAIDMTHQHPHPAVKMTPLPVQISQASKNLSQPPKQMCQPSQMFQYPQQLNYSSPQLSHAYPLWHPPPQMPYLPPQTSESAFRKPYPFPQMVMPRRKISNMDQKITCPQSVCVCDKCKMQQMLNTHSSQIILYPPPHTNFPQHLTNVPVKHDHVTPLSVSGSTIIGRNDSGVVRKINITAVHASGLSSPPVVQSNTEEVEPVKTKIKMLEELSKSITLKSQAKEESVELPMGSPKKDPKRSLSIENTLSDTKPKRKPRTGPLSQNINNSKQDLKRSLESSLPALHKGYSPPILPIATFEKAFEILAQNNIELFDNRSVKTDPSKIVKKTKNSVPRTKRILSFDERGDKFGKKISIKEYMKRSAQENNEIDFAIKRAKVDHNCGQNSDQDLGYDSDSTVKI